VQTPPKNHPKNTALDPEKVREIRRGVRLGFTAGHFARAYQVSIETIRKVVRYETWGWVSDEEGITSTPSETVPAAYDWAKRDGPSGPMPSDKEIEASAARLMKLLETPVITAREKSIIDLTPQMVESLRMKGQWTEGDQAIWDRLHPPQTS